MLSTLRRRPCFALRASPGTMILTTLRHMFPTQTIMTISWESSVQSLSRSVYLPAALLPYGILNVWCQERSSSKHKDIFAQIQRIRQKNSDLSLDPSIRDVTLGLLLDMPIRWSSTYVMLARALDLWEVSFGLSLEMRNSVAEAHNMISGCSTVCVWIGMGRKQPREEEQARGTPTVSWWVDSSSPVHLPFVGRFSSANSCGGVR